ncbi:hypothetical protein XPA_009957 [Xanthoria parietina]
MLPAALPWTPRSSLALRQSAGIQLSSAFNSSPMNLSESLPSSAEFPVRFAGPKPDSKSELGLYRRSPLSI